MQYIKVYENAIVSSVCDDIIQYFEKNKDNQYDGRVGGDGRLDKNIKVCKEVVYHTNNTYNTVLCQVLKKKFEEYVKIIPYIHHLHLIDEPWRIKKYNKNEGFFNWHIDNGSTHKSRLISAIFYLNDVMEGGETIFKIDEKEIKITPKKGSLLLFPANFVYVHKGEIPITNDKYIISTFLNITDLK